MKTRFEFELRELRNGSEGVIYKVYRKGLFVGRLALRPPYNEFGAMCNRLDMGIEVIR